MTDLKVYVSADTHEVDEAEKTTMKQVARMSAAIRRVAKLGMGLSILFGENVDQMMRLGIESALLTVELVTSSIAAQAAGNPILTLKSAAQLTTILSMWGLIVKMKRQRLSAQQESQEMANAYRLLLLT